MSRKVALITGITGQDGSYLAEFLLAKGYEVHGIKRRASSFNTERIDHIYQDQHTADLKLILHYGDLTDTSNIVALVQKIRPTEIYNLGAQSHVAVSFELPEYTADVDAIGTLRLLEAIRLLGMENECRFYQASTSELYGQVQESPQTEKTPFHPRSPYGVAKLYAYWICVNYREAYGMYACNGILFNHESPRRGETFVTRKITRGLCNIALGLDDSLYMGNMDSLRDWGYGQVQESPQTEKTPFHPRSPYGVAKLYAYWICVNYREAYGMYACNGILFNHESPRRGETFVTRKITRGLCNIALGLDDSLYMGNMDSLRDWGHARDYVEMQWLMLQQDEPEDFVIINI